MDPQADFVLVGRAGQQRQVLAAHDHRIGVVGEGGDPRRDLARRHHLRAGREQPGVEEAFGAELGATDEGPAGPRGDGFYAGYFRDPDGNKLNAYVMGPAA